MEKPELSRPIYQICSKCKRPYFPLDVLYCHNCERYFCKECSKGWDQTENRCTCSDCELDFKYEDRE